MAESGLASILSDRTTLFFVTINLLLTIYFAGYRFDRFASAHGPEILTTVGIFGCFLGIALALLNFDSRNVSASVPQLLEGIKTAFWASVSGVAGALVVRARHKFQKGPIQQSAGAPKASSIDDMVEATRALQRSLAGQEEGTLLSQLKLMRQEQRDQFKELQTSFDSFAQKMSEDGSKALIEALKAVIADFNAQINEQFGENFKHLNVAVEKLVIWQLQYKEELILLQVIQKSSADDLRVAASGVAVMLERALSFSATAKNLEEIIQALNHQYSLIQQSQESLSKVLVGMKDVAPQFAKRLEELMDSLKGGVTKVQTDVAELVKNLGSQVQSSNAELKQLMVDTLRRSQADVNDQLQKTLELIRQSVILLDKGLQEELNKSLETLGRQLASLSEKFVADYGPLTDRLREVVRLASRVG